MNIIVGSKDDPSDDKEIVKPWPFTCRKFISLLPFCAYQSLTGYRHWFLIYNFVSSDTRSSNKTYSLPWRLDGSKGPISRQKKIRLKLYMLRNSYLPWLLAAWYGASQMKCMFRQEINASRPSKYWHITTDNRIRPVLSSPKPGSFLNPRKVKKTTADMSNIFVERKRYSDTY